MNNRRKPIINIINNMQLVSSEIEREILWRFLIANLMNIKEVFSLAPWAIGGYCCSCCKCLRFVYVFDTFRAHLISITTIVSHVDKWKLARLFCYTQPEWQLIDKMNWLILITLLIILNQWIINLTYKMVHDSSCILLILLLHFVASHQRYCWYECEIVTCNI